MDFYTVLTEIMNEKGMTIPDVARACDLTDSTVRSIIDRKQKKIALNVAFKLHKGLGVSLERLNGMTEDSPDSVKDSEELVTREQLVEVLQKLGYLNEDNNLSNADLKFLSIVITMLDEWFNNR